VNQEGFGTNSYCISKINITRKKNFYLRIFILWELIHDSESFLFCPPLYLAVQVMVPFPLACVSCPRLTSIIDFSLKYLKFGYKIVAPQEGLSSVSK
jgi:hypothetical protein